MNDGLLNPSLFFCVQGGTAQQCIVDLGLQAVPLDRLKWLRTILDWQIDNYQQYSDLAQQRSDVLYAEAYKNKHGQRNG